MKGRKNIIFLSGVAVFVAALAVAGFLLIRGLAQLGSTQGDLQRSLDTLRSYYERNPFPSPGNVTKEQENAQLLTRLLQDVLDVAGKGQVEPVAGETPSRFISRLGEERNKLVAQAGAGGTTLPPDFAFGFDRYFTGGMLPAPEDVARLSQQLTIVDNLSTILFEERIHALSVIERDEFEAAARGSAARRPAGRLCTRSGDALSQMGVLGKDALFARLHFVVEIKATEKALLAVMNRLAKIAVVTGITLAKEGSDLLAPRVPGEEKAADVDDVGSPAERPAMTATNLAKIPRESRIVCGPAVERPGTVVLELDVYRFGRIAQTP
jgi:hypothetical protein